MNQTQTVNRAPVAAQPPGPSVDGRTARRDRNRQAVLDAVVELFREDKLSPGVHEVADRSGVSLRSVYRYFADIDALVLAASERQLERARPLFVIDDLGEGPLDERIDRFSRRRVELFEAIRDVYAAASLRAKVDADVADGLTRTRNDLAEQTEAMFAEELRSLPDESAHVVALTLDVLTQLDTLTHLRSERGLSVPETISYLADALGEVLPRSQG